MRLMKATAECPCCEQKFHQIDGTEERALQVVRAALDRHLDSDHPEAPERNQP
jgi:hypothetical protein